MKEIDLTKKPRPVLGGLTVMRDEERGCYYVRLDLSDDPTTEELTSLFEAIAVWCAE